MIKMLMKTRKRTYNTNGVLLTEVIRECDEHNEETALFADNRKQTRFNPLGTWIISCYSINIILLLLIVHRDQKNEGRSRLLLTV